MSDQADLTCINCRRKEEEVPLTAWRTAGSTFWICPECLPLLIHRRAEVMSRWDLPARAQTAGPGDHHA